MNEYRSCFFMTGHVKYNFNETRTRFVQKCRVPAPAPAPAFLCLPLLQQTAKKAGTQPNSEEVFDTTEENSISMKQERDSFKSAKLKILNIFF